MEIITINQGDTISRIAARYGLSEEKIIADNGLDKEGTLVVGQSLILLFPQNEYIINDSDETIIGVSLDTGITPRTLFRNNIFLEGDGILSQGDVIVTRYTDTPKLTKIIGGYAYDSIPQSLLQTVIPYMTYLMPFTYGFTPDGTLLLPNDSRLIETAVASGAMPLMHLSTLTEQGNFSNELAHLLLTNPKAIEKLYQNALDTVITKGYYGIDIDFEFLFAEDKERYVDFIRGITELMNANGYICGVALPPKTSDDQRGLLYEGIDYRALGEAANYGFLMTYEWGYRFGPPLAVAPIDSVRRVVEYALSRIPGNKILLGISNYGYDWILPFIRGESEAISISTVHALDIAKTYGAEISFDEAAMSPYFNYTDSFGREHIVWFEDARSYKAKVGLIEEYNLAGGFIWDLMRENPQGFVTLNALIDII